MADSKHSNGNMNETRSSSDDVSSLSRERRGCKRRLEGALANEQVQNLANNERDLCEPRVNMAEEESEMTNSPKEERLKEASDESVMQYRTADALQSAETPGETKSDTEVASDLPDGMILEWNQKKTRAVLTIVEQMSRNAASADRELRVCLVGRARISVLEGSAEVLGHALRTSNSNQSASDNEDLARSTDSVVVTSPYWSSWMTIEADPQCLPCKIVLKSVRGPESFWVTAPKRPIVLPDSWRNCADSIVQDFGALSSNDSTNAYRRRIADSLEDYDESREENRRICMITGAKGVGKSTLLRYLTNRILSAPSSRSDNGCNDNCEIDEVAILDTDVGQPELAPPGLLRLSIVRRPLLQPPYWNLLGKETMVGDEGEQSSSVGERADKKDKKEQSEGPSYGPQLDGPHLPEHKLENDEEEEEYDDIEVVSSVFFGASTSKVDPTRFIDAIQFLMEKYKTDVIDNGRYPVPLLINMDGWVKGVGYEILSALIESLEPTHLVQILGDMPGQTFDLPPSVNERGAPDDNEGTPIHANEMENRSIPPKVYTLQACQTMHEASLCRIPAFTTRNFRWATYFLPNELQTIDAWDFASAKDLQTGWIAATNSDRTTTVPYWWHTTNTIGDDVGNHDEDKNLDDDNEGSALNDDCRLAQALARERPYCVPMEAVDAFVIGSDFEDYLRLPDGETDPDIMNETQFRIFQALNGRIVSLCTDTSTMESLGYGVLRSIDWERRLLYVLVPSSVVSGENSKTSQILSKVKAIVGGNLPLPLALLYRGVYSESFSYLTSRSKEAILGSEPMKSRNNIGRRGLANAERNGN